MGSEDKFYLDDVTGAAARSGKGFLDSCNTCFKTVSPPKGSTAGAA